MLRCSRLALLAALIPLAAAAQNVSVGSLPQFVSTGMAGNGTFSVVDLSHPATAAGAVNSVSVTWTAGACANGFRVKFLRPSSIFGTYSIVAERGPFQAVGNTITYAIQPRSTWPRAISSPSRNYRGPPAAASPSRTAGRATRC